jgi:hypothetical protein
LTAPQHNLKTLKVKKMNSPRRNIDSWVAPVFLTIALITTPAPLQAQDAAAPADYVRCHIDAEYAEFSCTECHTGGLQK